MLDDTIAAIASPPGRSARGVIRISGPEAFAAAARVLAAPLPRERAAVPCRLRVRGGELDALALTMPGPASFTGEDVVELHLLGSPLLLDRALGALCAERTRLATPGEFTRRAFEHGKLGLEQAEAVAALIHADGRAAHRAAIHALQGGTGAAVAQVRARVQDALALIEAGLDFSDGETGEVDPAAWLPSLAAARAGLCDLIAHLPATEAGGEILLLGAANAGKSSLGNALLGRDELLVHARAGTTRDTLAVRLGDDVTLFDAPGDLAEPSAVDAAALALRDRLGARVAGALWVVDAAAPRLPAPSAIPAFGTVLTKLDLLADAPAQGADRAQVAAWLARRDLAALPAPWFLTSARDGRGLAELRAFLASRGRGHAAAGVAFGRWRAAFAAAEAALERAATAGTLGRSDELVAADLADALAALDTVSGRSSPEDLLDRIFAAFCLGK